ncbi:unnamed protein product [Adineta ricciae]|uniref:F-box domain-containing protein n=1 Tax=Adineta ricciae TaxID=249248 RepID=A0A815V0U1_ADIRI|nr:unnamed protein product [Adineta ricciae]
MISTISRAEKNSASSYRTIMKDQHNLFDRLPTEIFHLIFDYLWAHEIFFSFANLSDRTTSILLSYSKYQINFQSIQKSDFDRLCRSIQSEQVISLILSDQNDSPYQSEQFLSYFQIGRLTNLRSLSLIKIGYTSLYQILPSLSKLKRLRSLSFGNSSTEKMNILYEDTEEIQYKNLYPLLHKLCAEIFLQLTYLCTIYSQELASMHFPNLLHLKLNFGSLTSNLDGIFQRAPQLKSFTFHLGTLHNFVRNQPCYSLRQLSVISANVLMSMDEIEQFLRSFPNLIHFTIKVSSQHVDIDMIDGHRWQSITQSLSTFNFKLRPKNKVNQMHLDSFRTPFWTEEKRWFVAYHDEFIFTITDSNLSFMKISSDSFIYSTIPNSTILYQPQKSIVRGRASLANDFRFATVKSLELYWDDSWESLASFNNFNHVEHLWISSTSCHLLKHIQHHMPKLHTLSFLDDSNESAITAILYIRGLELKQIRTLQFHRCRFPKENVDVVGKLSDLFPCAEHIKKWIIKSRSDIIDIIGKFKELRSISFTIQKSVKKPTIASEFRSDSIVHDIRRHLRCVVICRVEPSSENFGLPECIHLWPQERAPNHHHGNYGAKNLFRKPF